MILDINKKKFIDLDQSIINIINQLKKNNNLDNKINNLENNFILKFNELKKNISNENINELKKLTSLEILEIELDTIKLILKYSLQNKNVEINFIYKSLNYLLTLSNILKNRLNQKDINTNKSNNLSRCSYKFCTFNSKCNYHYNDKNKNRCYQDHYVHNMVSNDIIIILKYINNINEEYVKPNKDLLKSLNTLSYVINHMESELRSKCIYYNKDEWDTFHI